MFDKKIYNMEYRIAHRDDMRAYSKQHYINNPDKYKDKNKSYVMKLKKQVIEAYGGKCICCGLAEWEFMTLDHIEGRNRTVDRDANGKNLTGYKLYFKLRQLGFPKGDYRVLCFNCNCVRGAFGYCPHEKYKIDFLEVVA